MLEVSSINKSFGNKKILKDISITINEGECFALLGKNGEGKSTLINIISDLLPPDNGTVKFDNVLNFENKNYSKKDKGFFLGSQYLIEDFTGLQYLVFLANIYGISDLDLTKRIQELTAYFFEEKDVLNKKIKSYSTGMKIKLGICGAVLHSPKFLILDEPFSGLDVTSSLKLIDFFKIFQQNRVVFLASHDLSYVEKIATHIGVLDKGSLLYNNTLLNFMDNGKLVIDEALLKYIRPKETIDLSNSFSWLK